MSNKEAFIEELTALSRKYGLYLEVTMEEGLAIMEVDKEDDLSKFEYTYDASYGFWGDLCWEEDDAL